MAGKLFGTPLGNKRGERKELEKVIGSKDIYTYTTAWVQEVER